MSSLQYIKMVNLLDVLSAHHIFGRQLSHFLCRLELSLHPTIERWFYSFFVPLETFLNPASGYTCTCMSWLSWDLTGTANGMRQTLDQLVQYRLPFPHIILILGLQH